MKPPDRCVQAVFFCLDGVSFRYPDAAGNAPAILGCIKSSQQQLAAGWENFIFFLCPLDGVQLPPSEELDNGVWFAPGDLTVTLDLRRIIWLAQAEEGGQSLPPLLLLCVIELYFRKTFAASRPPARV